MTHVYESRMFINHLNIYRVAKMVFFDFKRSEHCISFTMICSDYSIFYFIFIYDFGLKSYSGLQNKRGFLEKIRCKLYFKEVIFQNVSLKSYK